MLNTSSFKTVEELDKAYSEHRASLKASGIAYDDKALLSAWAEAVADLTEALNKPRDYSEL